MCSGASSTSLLISDALPFNGLWYGEPNAISNAIGCAKFRSRSHDAVIRVFDEAGNVIEMRECWHAEISCATEETPQGAAKVNPAARVGPTALAMRTLLFMYQITVWRVLGLNSR